MDTRARTASRFSHRRTRCQVPAKSDTHGPRRILRKALAPHPGRVRSRPMAPCTRLHCTSRPSSTSSGASGSNTADRLIQSQDRQPSGTAVDPRADRHRHHDGLPMPRTPHPKRVIDRAADACLALSVNPATAPVDTAAATAATTTLGSIPQNLPLDTGTGNTGPPEAPTLHRVSPATVAIGLSRSRSCPCCPISIVIGQHC